jgi:hypothetical protein
MAKIKNHNGKEGKMKEIGTEVNFLKDNLNKQLTVYHHYETRANFTIAISSGLMFFAINQLIARPELVTGLCVIIISSFVSLILSLLTIKPPKFMRKQRQEESIFSVSYTHLTLPTN